MKILIVNDDGIEAPGLALLANWAKKLGDVLVVAPKYEQSARSQSIDIRNSFEAVRRPIQAIAGIETWSVDSTPADCVRWAVSGIGYDADMVFAGVNNGYNLGADILYSGTVGAATEGILFGKKAVAFSTGYGDIGFFSENDLNEAWAYMTGHGMLETGDFWNVNIPKGHKGIKVTRQGGLFYRNCFEKVGENTVKQADIWTFQNRHDISVDTDAAMDGFISICPLTTFRTDFEVLKKYIN